MSVWNTLAGAFFGSLVAAGIVAWFPQRWIERRERRKRRDDLRLELYLAVVDLILDNQVAIAESGGEGTQPSLEMQLKRLHVSHRLKLLGSDSVRQAYVAYHKLVRLESTRPLRERPKNPNEVDDSRERLIEMMAKEVQEGEADTIEAVGSVFRAALYRVRQLLQHRD